jgi:hypothetical protein
VDRAVGNGFVLTLRCGGTTERFNPWRPESTAADADLVTSRFQERV